MGRVRRRVTVLVLPSGAVPTAHAKIYPSQRPDPLSGILGRTQRCRQAPASTQNPGYRREPRGSEVTVTQSAEEGTVTRASLREYATRQRTRYDQADRR